MDLPVVLHEESEIFVRVMKQWIAASLYAERTVSLKIGYEAKLIVWFVVAIQPNDD